MPLIVGVFLLAGWVKGVIGLGLPTVAVALLTATLGLPQALVLLLLPSLITNVWQALRGGQGRVLVGRLWPFFLLATVMIWPGALALTAVDIRLLAALLGLLLVVYACLGLSGIRMQVPVRHRGWAGPVVGLINGILAGMTGSFTVPGVMYLQSLALPRDQLVQAMGILFLVSTCGLAVALGGHGLLDPALVKQSAIALVPALTGMAIGATRPRPTFRGNVPSGLPDRRPDRRSLSGRRESFRAAVDLIARVRD